MAVAPNRIFVLALVPVVLAGCHTQQAEHHSESHTITATTPQKQSVTITQRYVCQIRSQRHIEVRALERGYLEAVTVKEGQAVKEGDVLFQVLPVIYQTTFDAELAEAKVAELELQFTQKLAGAKNPVVSKNDVFLHQAKLAKAKAQADKAEAELNFAKIKAPFDGIIDRLHHQQGSLVEDGGMLTTLSDNRVMWVYFNVPEARYLAFKYRDGQSSDHSRLKLVDTQIELVLADGRKFAQTGGDTVTVEGQFNNQTGNIMFRADFANPDGLLRHGQTGTVLIHQTIAGTVIPQRATFEILDKQYVFVVDEDNVVHQRQIEVEHELDDIFIVKGLDVDEKLVLEGIRQVRDGDTVEYEFEKPEVALANQKYPAE